MASSKFAARGGLDQNTLAALCADGASLREIARAVDRSLATVRYWLKQYGLESGGGRRRAERAAALARGEEQIELECPHHGRSKFVLESRGYYRCARCRQEAVAEWRRRTKARLVEEAGGCCALCGYRTYAGALQFHHLDPSTKSFVVSRGGSTRSMAEARAEAAKCVLLCANCHAEVEGGVASLDVELSAAKVLPVGDRG